MEYIHTSKDKNDECYTKRYAVEPLLEFLEPFRKKTIWLPFDTEESEFVKVFSEENFNIVYSHIEKGQDYYNFEPKKWDLLISNPPFTNKKEIFKRALSFKKPFALLMNLMWLNDATGIKTFSNVDLQLLLFTQRMTFKNQPQKDKISFMSAYFCWNFLPKQILIRNFENRHQLKLIEGVK